MANNAKLISLSMLLLLCMLLTACGTQPVSSTLIQKPAKPITSINIFYKENMLRSAKKESSAADKLHTLGYFNIGELMEAVGPGALSKRQLSGIVAYQPAESQEPVLFKQTADSLLTLTFLGGQTISRNGGLDLEAGLNLIATLTNNVERNIYWKGQYRVVVRKSGIGTVTFDKMFVADMLDKVFADIEEMGLIEVRMKATQQSKSDENI